MGYIIINGWEAGLEKVSLTKLQIDLLNKGLVEAKKNVDNILDGEIITIEVDNDVLASIFIKEAKKIGVLCHYADSIQDL